MPHEHTRLDGVAQLMKPHRLLARNVRPTRRWLSPALVSDQYTAGWTARKGWPGGRVGPGELWKDRPDSATLTRRQAPAFLTPTFFSAHVRRATLHLELAVCGTSPNETGFLSNTRRFQGGQDDEPLRRRHGGVRLFDDAWQSAGVLTRLLPRQPTKQQHTYRDGEQSSFHHHSIKVRPGTRNHELRPARFTNSTAACHIHLLRIKNPSMAIAIITMTPTTSG